jgi:hypothetical protein
MTRRDFIGMAAAVPSLAPASVTIPVHRVTDAKARFAPGALQHFWSGIWPEAVRTFGNGGIQLQTTDGPGEVQHTAADRPLFIGLRRGAINLVLTDHLPLYWDNARSLAGVTTLDRGYHLCLIALRFAHGNRVPYLSVNTCVHEILHALLQDIYVSRPTRFQSTTRESRVDWYATNLWLFRDGAAIRKSARIYLDRLASAPASPAPRNQPR